MLRLLGNMIVIIKNNSLTDAKLLCRGHQAKPVCLKKDMIIELFPDPFLL